jgi:hypothetical protein
MCDGKSESTVTKAPIATLLNAHATTCTEPPYHCSGLYDLHHSAFSDWISVDMKM